MQKGTGWMSGSGYQSQKSTSNSWGNNYLRENLLPLIEALDHLHVTKSYQEARTCTVCKKVSTKSCSGCSTFYCCSDCQNGDWQKHKGMCTKKESGLETSTSSNSRDIKSPPRSKVSSDVFPEDNLMMKATGSPFTALANQLNKTSGASFNKTSTMSNLNKLSKECQGSGSLENNGKAPRKTPPNGCRFFNHKKPFSAKKFYPEERSENSSSKDIKDDTSSNKEASSMPLKSVENIQNTISFPPVKKKEVVGIYRESVDRYWVMDISNVCKYEEIQTTLAKECDGYESVPPKIGLVCGCAFGDEWYRGKILSVSPKTRIHFIDYGNVSDYEFDFVKKLPDQISSVPGLAFLIEFEKHTPCEYKTRSLDTLQFTIEETRRTPDGFPCVEVIKGAFEGTGDAGDAEDAEQTSGKENADEARERSVMDAMTPESKGLLFLLPSEGNVRYGSLVPEGNENASISLEKILCLNKFDSVPAEADKGDYVLVSDNEGNDQRGRVISKAGSVYYVQLLDCGNVIPAGQVYSLSEDLTELVELGVRITVEEIFGEDKLSAIESCHFRITGEAASGKWPCVLSAENEEKQIARVLLEKPVPDRETEPKHVHLNSGSTVEISALCASNQFYIRSVDAETEQKFLEMNTEMIEFASKAKSFAVPPPPDVLCCAKFEEDQCFYRAVVTSRGAGKVTVFFVDFGNEQETDLKDVKPIPSSLKDIPYFASKVSVSRVSDKPWNNAVKDYLKKLITENVELILSYEKSMDDGVTLKEKRTGLVLNDFMENVLEQKSNEAFPLKAVPRFTKKNNNEVFLDEDIKYTSVPPNTDCDLALLYVCENEFENSHCFWATVAGTENFNYVNGELNAEITEYCMAISKPYRPTVRELCLAEFEGFWYRGLTVSSEGDLFKIFFLDFGNVCDLRPEAIRRIKKSFINPPSLAMNCTLDDRDRFKGRPELTERVMTFLQQRMNTCFEDATVLRFEKDTFYVKVKEIEAILSEG